ncbi:amidohydrolase family protein [Rhodospirillum sp. A1_3_36]|uniref:amidohydrolase family protein n=1 Tax=Rhodospirillum sp. A1_3_36 TaxID=3391666 RepID=UPI0039A570E3
MSAPSTPRMSGPHAAIRQGWLDRHVEPVLDPDQPILDAHHHLWDRPGSRYRVPEFLADLATGHDVRASLYVQCRTGYRETGPEALRPVGEVETVRAWGREAGATACPTGLIAHADLLLGDKAEAVITALMEAGEGTVRGIRNTTAHHPDPALNSNPRPPPAGLLRDPAFSQGAGAVAREGLVLDIWAYQTQLDEVHDLAAAHPDLTVVIDHLGGPLGAGPFRENREKHFADWRAGVERLARLPNTRIKIGGFGLVVMGKDYHLADTPPSSEQLAQDWAAYVDVCLNAFGPDRAMFESNFPVDKGMFSYPVIWNAFKRLARSYSAEERAALFYGTASATYGIALPGS